MKNISAKYIGLGAGILMVAASLLMFYTFHLPESGIVKYVCYSIYTIAIIIGLLNFKNRNPEVRPFKEYFSEGFKVFVVVTLIMAVFTFIFYKLNPQIIENDLAQINKYNLADSNKTAAEVAENGKQFRKIFIPMTVITTMIMYFIIGALVSLIGAGLLSQKKDS